MAIESQWKDPKKRNRNIIIGLIILVVVVYAYYNCWFRGPNAKWDLNWGPSYCLLGQGPEDAGGSSDCSGQCPPLDDKMKSAYPSAMYQTAQMCDTMGGDWTENDYEVSCADPTEASILCEGAAFNTAAAVCHALGGAYHCQADWVGCYCPGSGPVPYDNPRECSKTVTWSSDDTAPESNCYGACELMSANCGEDQNGDCTCGGGDDYISCGFQSQVHSQSTCFGECPIPEQTCYYSEGILQGEDGCRCVTIPV